MKRKFIGERKDGEDSALTFAATTLAVDRHGEVVVPEGGKASFPQYKDNPVLFYGHMSSPFWDGQKESLPIGRADNLRLTDDNSELLYDATFSKTNDFAQVVEGLVKEGALSATSIGFVPKVIGTDPVLDGQTGVTHLEWELLENSICGIPANGSALRRAVSKSAVCKRFEKELLPAEIKLTDGVYRGMTDKSSDGHTHSYLIEVNEGQIVLGATSFEDNHFHTITNEASTDSSDGHVHLITMEKIADKSLIEVMAESFEIPLVALEWTADDLEAIKKFLNLREELKAKHSSKKEESRTKELVSDILSGINDITQLLYDPKQVIEEGVKNGLTCGNTQHIRGK